MMQTILWYAAAAMFGAAVGLWVARWIFIRQRRDEDRTEATRSEYETALRSVRQNVLASIILQAEWERQGRPQPIDWRSGVVKDKDDEIDEIVRSLLDSVEDE